MYLQKAKDLKKYILETHPQVIKERIDVLKVGSRMYLIMVSASNTLVKERIFIGALETVNDLTPMKRILDANILMALTKHGLIKQN